MPLMRFSESRRSTSESGVARVTVMMRRTITSLARNSSAGRLLFAGARAAAVIGMTNSPSMRDAERCRLGNQRARRGIPGPVETATRVSARTSRRIAMRLFVNGEPRDVAPGATVEQLLAALGIDRREIGVALNREVLP